MTIDRLLWLTGGTAGLSCEPPSKNSCPIWGTDLSKVLPFLGLDVGRVWEGDTYKGLASPPNLGQLQNSFCLQNFPWIPLRLSLRAHQPSFCLCSAELCLFLLHRCWSQSSPYSLLHTNPFWVCFPGNPAWVCTNKRANPGCFYVLGVQSGAFGIASLHPHTQSGLSFRLHLAIIPKSSSVVIIKPQTFTYPVYSNYLKEHLPSFSPQL